MKRLLLTTIAALAAVAAPATSATRPIQLAGKPQGGQNLILVWSNTTTTFVAVQRDGATIAVTNQRPNWFSPYKLAGQPLGSHVYKVCELTGRIIGRCSNPYTAAIV